MKRLFALTLFFLLSACGKVGFEAQSSSTVTQSSTDDAIYVKDISSGGGSSTAINDDLYVDATIGGVLHQATPSPTQSTQSYTGFWNILGSF